MGIPLSALIIGQPADAQHVVDALERAMCTPIYKCINDDPTILAELQSASWDLAFHCRPATQGTDLGMLRFMRDAKKHGVLVIFLSENYSDEDAANLVGFGAQDCVPKNKLTDCWSPSSGRSTSWRRDAPKRRPWRNCRPNDFC